MKNSMGSSVILTVFGESHGSGIGAILDGMAPGIEVDEDDMDFNEDENYVFDHLYEAQEHLEAILENMDNLDQLRENFKLMFPKEHIEQISGLLNILLRKQP